MRSSVQGGRVNSNMAKRKIAVVMRYWWDSGGGSPDVQGTTEAQQRFGNSLVADFDPSLLGMSWKESNAASAVITPVAIDTDPVGLVQDTSPNAHLFTASGDTIRPLLGSDAEVNAFHIYDGSNDVLTWRNSLACMRNMVGLTPTFSIFVKFKMAAGTDGSSRVILSSNDLTAGRTGFTIQRTIGNKIRFHSTTNGAPNVVMIDKTTTANYVVADGWISLKIVVNGVGAATCSIYKNSDAAETASVTAGYDQNMTDLCLMGRQSNTSAGFFSGNIGQVKVLNVAASAADRTWFDTYNPAKTTTLKPVNLERHLDFSLPSSMYTERTSPATNVSANDDPIGYIFSQKLGNFGGTLNRDAAAPSDAKRPLYKTNVQNGLSTGFWNGDSTRIEVGANMELFFQDQWYKGGAWTVFIILKGDQTDTEGRKFFSDGASGVTSGTNYATQTDENDPSNTPGQFGYPNGTPTMIWHPGGAAYGIQNWRRNNAANIYCCILGGTSVTIINGAGEVRTEATTGAHNYSKLGGIAGTWTFGKWYELKRYSGNMTVTQAQTEIAALAVTKWAL